MVLELSDEEPIYICPLGREPRDLDGFARKLRADGRETGTPG